jgi:hypothetical protein
LPRVTSTIMVLLLSPKAWRWTRVSGSRSTPVFIFNSDMVIHARCTSHSRSSTSEQYSQLPLRRPRPKQGSWDGGGHLHDVEAQSKASRQCGRWRRALRRRRSLGLGDARAKGTRSRGQLPIPHSQQRISGSVSDEQPTSDGRMYGERGGEQEVRPSQRIHLMCANTRPQARDLPPCVSAAFAAARFVPPLEKEPPPIPAYARPTFRRKRNSERHELYVSESQGSGERMRATYEIFARGQTNRNQIWFLHIQALHTQSTN